MALGLPVYSTGPFTALEMAEEDKATWGTVSGSFFGVPAIRETLKMRWKPAPNNPEFQETGGERSHSYLGQEITGTVEFHARLDGPWFNILMAHLFGEEKLVPDTGMDGTAATGLNTHYYLPHGGQRSLQARAWKSGQDDSGSWHLFTGLMFKTCRIEFPQGGILKFTGDFLGKAETADSVSGTPAAPVGDIHTSARWLSNTDASFQVGASMAEFYVSDFTINYDRQLVQDDPFLNSMNDGVLPGTAGPRQISVDIGTLLFQDFMANNKPSKEYHDRDFSKCRIVMTDTTAVAGSYKGMMWDFPNIAWIDPDDSLKESGAIPVSYSFKALEGATASPALGTLDCMAAVAVAIAEDSDTYFAAEVEQS